MASLRKRARISEKPANIRNDVLIDDVLVKIIQNVPIAQWCQLESISKQFQRCVEAAYRSLVLLNLKSVFLPKFGKYSAKGDQLLQFLKKLARCYPILRTIIGFDCLSDDGYVLPRCKITDGHLEFLQKFTLLQNIRFENCIMNIGDFSNCMKKFPDLKTLEIRGCIFLNHTGEEDISADYSVYFDFFEHFSGLTELTIAGFKVEFSGSFLTMVNAGYLKTLNFSRSKFQGNYVTALLNRCQILETLYLFDPLTCVDKNRVGLELEVIQCLPNLAKLCKLQLEIDCHRLDPFVVEYTGGDLLNVLFQCKRLKEISLCCEKGGIVTDDFVKELVKECPMLESLDLNAEKCYSKETLSKITDLQNLTSLCLRYCNERSLNKLCLKLDKLDKLSCLTIGAFDFDVTERELSSLKNLKNLTSLIFKATVFSPDRRSPFTEKLVRSWIKAGFVQKLTTLKLFTDVTHSVVKLIAENASVLNTFCFDGEINDKTLLSIAENCKYLQLLDIERIPKNTGISEKGILAFLSKCSGLRRLIINDSFRIRSAAARKFQPYKNVIWFESEFNSMRKIIDLVK